MTAGRLDQPAASLEAPTPGSEGAAEAVSAPWAREALRDHDHDDHGHDDHDDHDDARRRPGRREHGRGRRVAAPAAAGRP